MSKLLSGRLQDAIAIVNCRGELVYLSENWAEDAPILTKDIGIMLGEDLLGQLATLINPKATDYVLSPSLVKQTLAEHISSCLRSTLSNAEASAVINYSIPQKDKFNNYSLHIEACSGRDAGVVLRHTRLSNSLFMDAGIPLDSNFYEVLFKSLEDGVIYQNLEGYIELANPAAERILGFTFDPNKKSSLFGDQWSLLELGGAPIEDKDRPIVKALRNGKGQYNQTLGVVKPDGDTVWLRVNLEIIRNPANKLPHGCLISFGDITEETKIKQDLVSASERLHLALDGASIGIWDWYVEDENMIWDDQMYNLYGLPEKKTITVKEAWNNVAHPDDNRRVMEELLDLLKTRSDCVSEFRVMLPDGNTRHLRAYARAVLNSSGRVERVVGMNWDVTKEIEAEKRLEKIAFNDDLTGLSNRASFNSRLEFVVDRAKSRGVNAGLLVLDLDHFKDVNDNYGHPVGDSLIKQVVARVKSVLIGDEYFARTGGDEFAIVFESVSSEKAILLYGDRIHKAMDEPIYLEEGPVINARMSMGAALYPHHGENAVALIKSADIAMHQAKKSGRNNVVVYRSEYLNALEKRTFLEEELRSAIRDEELMLYYQPIIDLETKIVVGCEALLRWIDRSGNFVSPVDFIPVAEETGLIYELGNWINSTAFKQLKLWQALDTTISYISVNVSPHQLQNSNFISDIKLLLEVHDINPCYIQLEITEGTFLQESLNAASQLKELGDMGFRLAIDDFGTGYSSLAYLKRFDVDVIKIDRSFIKDLEKDSVDRDIVKAILAMTDSLGFDTLVEGVETDEQCGIVSGLGCGYAQGYLYGKPTFPDEFAEKYIGVSGKGPKAIVSGR